MSLNVEVGGMKFKLAVSSDGIPPSFFSVKYSGRDDGEERDAVVELVDFSGTLHICKSSGSDQLEKKMKPERETKLDLLDLIAGDENKTSVRSEEMKKDPEEQPNSVSGKCYKRKNEENLKARYSQSTITVPASNEIAVNCHDESKQRSNDVSFIDDILLKKEMIPRKSSSEKFELLEQSLNSETVSSADKFATLEHSLSSQRLLSTDKPSLLDYSGLSTRPLFQRTYGKRKYSSLMSVSHDSLHRLCGMENVSVRKLEEILKSKPLDASLVDKEGRLPLHIIAQNEKLVFGVKQKLIESFVHQLIKVYPQAISTYDNSHRIPFTSPIKSWIDELHSTEMRMEEIKSSFVDINLNERQNQMIPHAPIYGIVEWCFKMLSDQFVRKDYSTQKYQDSSVMNNRKSNLASKEDPVMQNFCSIPLVLKTVLLIDEDLVRIQILELPIFKQALLNKNLIGDWIVCVLLSKSMSSRVIDYFELISNLTINEAFDIYRRPRVMEKRNFIKKRNAIIKRIAHMRGIIPALSDLEPQQLSRACGTIVVQQIIDIYMVRPGVTHYYLLNLSMSILLMISFDVFVDLKSSETKFNIFGSPGPLIIIICVILLGQDELVYFVSAKKSKTLQKFLKRKFLKISNLIQLLSVVTVMGVTFRLMSGEQNPSTWILSVSKMLVWVPIFHLLKGINHSLASFLYSVEVMVRGLIWCLLIFFLIIAIFANIITFTFKDNGGCSDTPIEDPTIEDFCSGSRITSFIRAYTVIIGEFTLESYNENMFTSILLFLYSIVGSLFFINVVIVVICRCYEESFSQQNRVLGVYRIPFLAKIRLLQVIMKDTNVLFYTICIIFIFLFQIFLFGYFYTFTYTNSPYDLGLSVLFTILFYFSLCSMIILVRFHKGKTGRTVNRRFSNNDSLFGSMRTNATERIEIILNYMHIFSYRFFGIKEMDATTFETSELANVECLCQHILVETKQLVNDSEFRILSQLKQLQLQSNVEDGSSKSLAQSDV